MRAFTAFFSYALNSFPHFARTVLGPCLLNKSFMWRNPEITALDREVLRIHGHCSIGCFHKSWTFLSLPYNVSEVKPTTCFAVIRKCFAIWPKVQLPRAAILDCSSFSPMIELSLTFFYLVIRMSVMLFFFFNRNLTHDDASNRIVRLWNVIWSLECFSRTHGWNATPLSYVESNENWCLRSFIIVADDWYSWWKFSWYFMHRCLQCISYLLFL